jgi:uncharacterized protein (TIGR02265 family)
MFEKKIDGENANSAIIGSGATENHALVQILRERFNFNYKNPPVTLNYADYLAMLEYIRQALYSDLTIEEGYETLGMSIARGHFQGVLGKVNLLAAKLVKPEQGFELFVRATKNALPFARYEVEELSKKVVRYRQIGVPGPPALERGIILGCLQVSGAKNIQVTSKEIQTEEVVFEVSWD